VELAFSSLYLLLNEAQTELRVFTFSRLSLHDTKQVLAKMAAQSRECDDRVGWSLPVEWAALPLHVLELRS
jgi:hypothetical protein